MFMVTYCTTRGTNNTINNQDQQKLNFITKICIDVEPSIFKIDCFFIDNIIGNKIIGWITFLKMGHTFRLGNNIRKYVLIHLSTAFHNNHSHLSLVFDPKNQETE